MKKILLVVARYCEQDQQIFNQYISPRNKAYAHKHGYQYLEINNDISDTDLIKLYPTLWRLSNERKLSTWKFSIAKDLIENKQLDDGDILVHLDADIYIVDDNCDLLPPKSLSYSIDSGNTHCMGWYSMKINSWTKAHIDNMLLDERYQKFINKQTPHLGGMSSFWEIFGEQASWYSLAGIKRHSDIPFWNIPNYGFHSDNSYDTVYSIDELNEHVHIFGTEYNVTEWLGESGCYFNINKLSSRSDVKIRHFASGQWKNPNLIENWMRKI